MSNLIQRKIRGPWDWPLGRLLSLANSFPRTPIQSLNPVRTFDPIPEFLTDTKLRSRSPGSLRYPKNSVQWVRRGIFCF
jgi:hypothetical protein